MKNLEISAIFREITKILEIKGENPFRIRAYDKAAQTLESLTEDIETVAEKDELENIAGIGKDLALKIKEILKTADGVLVIGSRTSANTQRLVKIVRKYKKPVWRANSIKELEKISFGNISVLGVVSGTSAPDWEVEEIKNILTIEY